MVEWRRKVYQRGAETYYYYVCIFQHPNQTWGQEVLVKKPLVPELVSGSRIGFDSYHHLELLSYYKQLSKDVAEGSGQPMYGLWKNN